MEQYFYLFLVLGVVTADLNILVIGSSKSYSDRGDTYPFFGESGTVKEKAFNHVKIANELQSILTNDASIKGTVAVSAEDLYRSKEIVTAVGGSGSEWTLTYHSYSLLQYYHWPENRTTRLNNLQGKSGTVWDFVIIIGDPYLLANMPGIYAEGVNRIAQQVNTDKLILLMQWPESTNFDVAHFGEITYRVGNSLGVKVVPAGYAWESLVGKDSSSEHPTPNGAYLAAACIYSKLFNRNAASDSKYIYENRTQTDSIAEHALETVQDDKELMHYSGKFTFDTPFSMEAVHIKRRDINSSHSGSSSERGINGALSRVMSRCMVNYKQYGAGDPDALPSVDFNFGRANDRFEANKKYKINQTAFGRSYGFPMQEHKNTADVTQLYGIDKRYDSGDRAYEDGTDLGIAYDMIRQDEVSKDVRTMPLRLFWAKLHDFENMSGVSANRDNWHMSGYIDEAAASYMYTSISGRCCVGDEPEKGPTDEWRKWLARHIGYESAWRLSTLQARTSGFEVLPSARDARIVTPSKKQETLTVRFLYAPTSDVTVSVSVDNPNAAIATPKSLTFTTENYATIRTVHIGGLPGLVLAEDFNVQFFTESSDEIFDKLSDSWDYSNTRELSQSTTVINKKDITVICKPDSLVVVDLGVNGASSDNTEVYGPAIGSIAWSGLYLNYTAKLDYIGIDSIAYVVQQSGSLTKGHVSIYVQSDSLAPTQTPTTSPTPTKNITTSTPTPTTTTTIDPVSFAQRNMFASTKIQQLFFAVFFSFYFAQRN